MAVSWHGLGAGRANNYVLAARAVPCLVVLLSALAAGRALAAPTSTPDEPVSVHAGAWLGVCDNFRDCTLLGFADDDAAVLTIRLPRVGRDPSGNLLLRLEHAPLPGMIRLQTGRHGATPGVRTIPAGTLQVGATLDAGLLRGLLPALRQAGRLSAVVMPVRAQGRSVVLASTRLFGAAVVLDWINRDQRRPPLPVEPDAAAAAPPDPSIAPPPGTLPAPVAVLPAVRACLAQDSERPGQGAAGVALSRQTVLWRIPCGSGNFSQDSLFVVDDGTQHPVPASFNSPPQFPARPPGILVNAEIDAEHRLTATEPARGLNDCGDVRSYRWDGRRFRLWHARLMTACHGLPPEQWPVVYRSTPDDGGRDAQSDDRAVNGP